LDILIPISMLNFYAQSRQYQMCKRPRVSLKTSCVLTRPPGLAADNSHVGTTARRSPQEL
jgi:hypothetical protein